MKTSNAVDIIKNLPRGSELSEKIDLCIKKQRESSRPFFVLLIQIQNLESYSKRHPRYVTLNLMKEVFAKLRRVIHKSQFIGSFQNGYGIVFEGIDVGLTDQIGRKLSALTMRVIREGQYNDLKSRWTDIIQNFLLPHQPTYLIPRIGWGIYPRDGHNSQSLVKRALYHLNELNR